jgi:ATP-dependent RNA helicase RhlE
MSFSDLGLLPELARAVAEKGYETPTPIQLQAIPAVLEGRDLLASAQTGTGKTAAFVLPILQRLQGASGRAPRALVLTPTRELAAQITESAQTYGKHLRLRTVVVFGGVGINPQIDALRAGCDLLIATPGRLLDLAEQRAVDLSRCSASCSTRPTACSTWASSARSVRSSRCCRASARIFCSRRPTPRTSAPWRAPCCARR